MTQEEVTALVDIEKSLLGAILTVGVFPTLELRPEWFLAVHHQELYRVLLTMRRDGVPVDLLTANYRIAVRNFWDRVGGMAYVAGLIDRVPDVSSLEAYARIVRDAFIERSLEGKL